MTISGDSVLLRGEVCDKGRPIFRHGPFLIGSPAFQSAGTDLAGSLELVHPSMYFYTVLRGPETSRVNKDPVAMVHGNRVRAEYSQLGGRVTDRDLESLAWRKSSTSGMSGCVEVAIFGEFVVVRDSKNANGGNLQLTLAVWEDFVAALKAGNWMIAPPA